jgi:hypothetical protein
MLSDWTLTAQGDSLSAEWRFLLQLGATVAGTVLDIIVGKVTNRPTLIMAVWAIVAIIAAAAFEFFKDRANDEYTIHGVNRLRVAPSFFRPPTAYHFGVFVKAVLAALFAGFACCVLSLAVIVCRFLIMHGGARLGKGSPFDVPIVTFVSNFQTSGAIAALIIGTFVLAVMLKSEFVLPVGIFVASVVNAWQVPIFGRGAPVDGYHSDLAQSLSVPNGLLFQMPSLSVPVGCLVVFGVGLVACAIVAAFVRS